jgi:hypothetical protein
MIAFSEGLYQAAKILFIVSTTTPSWHCVTSISKIYREAVEAAKKANNVST